MNERSGAHEQSEQGGASEQASGVRERTNGHTSGPAVTSGFLVILHHSEVEVYNVPTIQSTKFIDFQLLITLNSLQHSSATLFRIYEADELHEQIWKRKVMKFDMITN